MKKLSKLNLDLIKQGAFMIEFDSKLLGKLHRDAVKKCAVINREKRRIYNLERRRKNSYYDKYGQQKNYLNTPERIEARSATTAKRTQKNKDALKVCPAALWYSEFIKAKSYTMELKLNETIEIDGVLYYKEQSGFGELKRCFKKWSRKYEFIRASEAITALKACGGSKPLKLNSRTKCKALIQADYKLCPLVQDISYINDKKLSKCEMRAFLQMFRDEAPEALLKYIAIINGTAPKPKDYTKAIEKASAAVQALYDAKLEMIHNGTLPEGTMRQEMERAIHRAVKKRDKLRYQQRYGKR
jgi:hypothetical protein